MSITDPVLPRMDHEAVQHLNHFEFVSLNEIFKDCMKTVQTLYNNIDINVRCESLPEIHGKRTELAGLFDTLMNLMLKVSDTSSRLFLHVDCEEEDKPGTNRSGQSNKNYTIKFHSNISINESWKEMNIPELEKCEQILSSHHGTFVVNHLYNGCLFSLTLPGK